MDLNVDGEWLIYFLRKFIENLNCKTNCSESFYAEKRVCL